MLPRIFRAWSNLPFSTSLSSHDVADVTLLYRARCSPWMLVPLLALFQKECTELKDTVQYAIKMDAIPSLDISAFIKDQYLQYFSQGMDKFDVLLFNPEDIIEPNVLNMDIADTFEEQVTLADVIRHRVYKPTYYDVKISGTLTPKNNRTYVNKKVSMCFRSQIFI